MKKKKATRKKVPDARYITIRSLYKDGLINSLIDIFKYVPKTIVATDMHTKVARLTALLNDPTAFTLEELYKIGELCGLAEREIYLLCEEYFFSKEEEKRKKREDVETLIKKME